MCRKTWRFESSPGHRNVLQVFIILNRYPLAMPMVVCNRCDKPFYAKPSWLAKGNGKFCSLECYRSTARKGRNIPCDTCGSVTYRQSSGIAKSKSGKFFCSKSCQTRWRNQLYVGEQHKNFINGGSTYRAVIKRSNVPKVCGLCRSNDLRVLAVHHIDKNRKNNKLENLAWLCHNCHYLVHHDERERAKFMAAIV